MNILDKTDRSLAPIPHRTRADLATDKAIKFSWATGGNKGEFRWINKAMLSIDGRYQREAVSIIKVREIAANWDWLILGVISVIMRADGSLWVFDGGHRVRAAFYRSDIHELPCLVHAVAQLSDEAKSFVARNSMTSCVSALARHAASVVANEPIATEMEAVLSATGVVVCKNPSSRNQTKAVAVVRNCVAADPVLARDVLHSCMQLHGDEPISASLLGGLFYLCKSFKGKVGILSVFSEKINKLSRRELEIRIRQKKLEVGKGGDAIEAAAILDELNKNKKNRLSMPSRGDL